jgi:hypothetical protein
MSWRREITSSMSPSDFCLVSSEYELGSTCPVVLLNSVVVFVLRFVWREAEHGALIWFVLRGDVGLADKQSTEGDEEEGEEVLEEKEEEELLMTGGW